MDYNKSIELNQQCLKIYENLYGKENIYYLKILNNLASNYTNLGDYSKSKELNEECLKNNQKGVFFIQLKYGLFLHFCLYHDINISIIFLRYFK